MLYEMPKKRDGKTVVYSVRIPVDLNDRFTCVRDEQAHKKVPSSELLLEAVRLYVELAESFGIDEDLRIKKAIGSYRYEASSEPNGSKGGSGKSKTG